MPYAKEPSRASSAHKSCVPFHQPLTKATCFARLKTLLRIESRPKRERSATANIFDPSAHFTQATVCVLDFSQPIGQAKRPRPKPHTQPVSTPFLHEIE